MQNRKPNYQKLYSSGFIGLWYLRKSQRELYKLLRSKKRIVANCHRRFGKGTTVLVYAFERAIRERIIIRYGAPTQGQAYDILQILIDHIYEHAPTEKPKLSQGDYVWPSGSRLQIFGCKDSGEADKARGTEAHIIICDEFGFWKFKPEYILKSVLSPQLDTTDGQLIISSTPPEDLTHYYLTELANAELESNLFRWDIDDSLRVGDVSKDLHQKIIERCGGVETDAYKREYKLDLIANRSRLVIPEAQDESLYVGTQPKPEYFHWFMVCDLGLKDFFAALWGYVDFKEARLVIVKEFVANYLSTSEIAKECKRIEAELNTPIEFRRLGDSSDPQQLYDLSKDHGYAISGIVKRSKMNNQGFRESVLNGLRVAISQGKILMEPDVQNTRIQLKYGIWNEKRTDFERTEKLGHLDALMALAYMVDNADYSDNPYPIIPREAKEGTHFINPELKKSSHVNLKRLVGI
jgi:hypothetical protein